MGSEFRKHVKWPPGGRLKRGHIDYDPIFDQCTGADLVECESRKNRRARAIILNFVRDYGDLEYINVGWSNESLSRAGRSERGHRDVYVVAMKRARKERGQVHLARMQKWDVMFRLDDGKSAQRAMFETEEYMEYTRDRYLGCRRLGMKLCGPVRIGKISELYNGRQTGCAGNFVHRWNCVLRRLDETDLAKRSICEDITVAFSRGNQRPMSLGDGAEPDTGGFVPPDS